MPQRPREPPRESRLVGLLVWLVLLAIPAALVGGGGFLLYQRTSGTRVQATVLDCDLSGGRVGGASTYRQDCTAQWIIDGEVVVGVFSGGNGDSDVGKTVEATVRGDTAYSRSLRLPIVLIALGLPFLVLPVVAIRSRLKARSSRRDLQLARANPDAANPTSRSSSGTLFSSEGRVILSNTVRGRG